MGRRLRSLLVALVGAVALVAPGTAAAIDRYVALGDSFASGPVIPLYEQPFGCLRSTNNYAHLIKQRLRIATFRDVTCAGASTKHMFEPHGVTPGPANPPQLSALTSQTELVTLQIGGNDMGFGSIAEKCFSLDPYKSSCQAKFFPNGQDSISARIAAAAPKVAAVLDQIHVRSPQARVLVINYSAIFPRAGEPLCWPFLPVAAGDVHYLRSKHEELNAMLASAAAAGGAELVDVYAASRGHDACKLPLIRWVEPAIPLSLAAPVHPNLQGMDAMARLVVAAL